jgi:hypothetical protein
MARRVNTKADGVPRDPGPVKIDGSRFPLGGGLALDYVYEVHRLVYDQESFLVILYGAQNAMGLIATEHNGIAILWETQGRAVLLDHACDGSYMQASPQQRAEYARICGLGEADFRAFVNSHPRAGRKVLVAKPAPILRPKLNWKVEDFQGDQWTSAEDKLKFLLALVRFLCNHCPESGFTWRIYEGLHQHLGHIAHYNRAGFYAEWFETLKDRIRFFKHWAKPDGYSGSWADVNRALRAWVLSDEGRKVGQYYRDQLRIETEMTERAQLAALKEKYEQTSI